MERADGEACYLSITFPRIAICTKASESLGCVEKDQKVAGNASGRMPNVLRKGRLISSGQSHLSCHSSLSDILLNCTIQPHDGVI